MNSSVQSRQVRLRSWYTLSRPSSRSAALTRRDPAPSGQRVGGGRAFEGVRARSSPGSGPGTHSGEDTRAVKPFATQIATLTRSRGTVRRRYGRPGAMSMRVAPGGPGRPRSSSSPHAPGSAASGAPSGSPGRRPHRTVIEWTPSATPSAVGAIEHQDRRPTDVDPAIRGGRRVRDACLSSPARRRPSRSTATARVIFRDPRSRPLAGGRLGPPVPAHSGPRR